LLYDLMACDVPNNNITATNTGNNTTAITKESECIKIIGFYECYWWQKSTCYAMEAKSQQKDIVSRDNLHLTFMGVERNEWLSYLNLLKQNPKIKARIEDHQGKSPLILKGCTEENMEYVGGTRDLVAILKHKFNYNIENCD